MTYRHEPTSHGRVLNNGPRLQIELMPLQARKVHALLLSAVAILLEARHESKTNGLPVTMIADVEALAELADTARATMASHYTRGRNGETNALAMGEQRLFPPQPTPLLTKDAAD
jgi:hypothetical protein